MDQKSGENKKKGNTFNSWWYLIIVIAGIVALRQISPIVAQKLNKKDAEKQKELLQNKETSSAFILKNETGKVLLQLNIHRIIEFEANDNYVITYYLTEENVLKKSMERSSLKKIEELIGNHPDFFRVHKSYIINKKYVHSIGGKAQGYKIQMQFVKEAVPVSRSFKISQISE